jgi:hypothetical protein
MTFENGRIGFQEKAHVQQDVQKNMYIQDKFVNDEESNNEIDIV